MKDAKAKYNSTTESIKKLTSKGRGYAPTCVTRIKFVFSIVKSSSCCAQRAVVTGQAISEPN